MSHTESSSQTVNPVSRTLDVLEALAHSPVPLSFTDLCTRTVTPKATMHRTLATLQARGYVQTDHATGNYAAGVRCLELGGLWLRQLDLRGVAAPHLQTLNAISAETVHLAVYESGDVIYIDKLESPQQVIAKSHVGRRCPAVAVATGRVLLATRDRSEIERVLSGPLEQYTEHSITDPDELLRMLNAVHTDGYAINRGSYRDGVSGIAAPIRDHTGAVVASVGLCLPEYRFTDNRFAELCDWTINAANAISRSLGGLIASPASHEPERPAIGD